MFSAYTRIWACTAIGGAAVVFIGHIWHGNTNSLPYVADK
jgi:hypothetical protein